MMESETSGITTAFKILLILVISFEHEEGLHRSWLLSPAPFRRAGFVPNKVGYSFISLHDNRLMDFFRQHPPKSYSH